MPPSPDPALPRVAIFGATGRLGGRVLARLVERGCDVRLLVPFADHLDYDVRVRLRGDAVVEGDPRDADLVLSTLAGAEVVVSALDPRDLAESATGLTDALRTIVGTMPAAGAGRIVVVGCMTALRVAAGGTRTSGATAHESSEPERQHEVLRNAPVEWTLFCPADVREGASSGAIRMAIDAMPAGGGATGLDDLANAMVAEALEPRFTGHRVGIASAAP